MQPYEMIALASQYENEREKLASLVARLKSDLNTYIEKNPSPSQGQKIHIEIRQSVIHQIEVFVDVTEALFHGLQQQMYEIQTDINVQSMKAQISALSKRIKKAEMVLTQGFNYNISLLEYQRPNDFIF